MARTQRERDAEKRDEKLGEIREQVAEGRLSIRQMTDEERAHFGAIREERERHRPKKAPRGKR